MGKRRQFTSEYKAGLVLELIRGERTLGEIASTNQINPNQLARWRQEFMEKAPSVFDEPKTTKARQKAEEEAANEKIRLLKTIGQLTMERDYLQEAQAKQYDNRSFSEVSAHGLTIERRCELLSLNRWSAYRKPPIPNSRKMTREEQLCRRIDYWHTQLPCCGARKLQALLRDEDGLRAGRKLIKRLMDEMGIYAVYPKPRLSKPGKDHKRFPYLLKNKSISFPNQVWAMDITYIPMKHGHMYLTAIIDWYSRYIVGWALSDTLDTAPVMEALTRAMRDYGIPGIINTDQGSQFTSDVFVNALKMNGIRQSMDGKARWIDNVIIERWFRSLKTECVYINEYATPRKLHAGIDVYVKDYNHLRPHQSHDQQTPAHVYTVPFSAGGIA